MNVTPAQIEAAAKALKETAADSYRDIAIVALTAAAEVGAVTCLDIKMATQSAVNTTIERLRSSLGDMVKIATAEKAINAELVAALQKIADLKETTGDCPWWEIARSALAKVEEC